jgi:hypothetical protein
MGLTWIHNGETRNSYINLVEALMANWKTERRQEYSTMIKLIRTGYQTGTWMKLAQHHVQW